jgi:pimeloyl-ACP methyl ester carboxylesterase
MRRLLVGDRRVRVRDEGSGRKPPLVCVHGAASSSVVWMETVRRLAPGRRVVAPDLPGHGQSDRWHPPAEVSIAMYRDAVGTVCATLKLERVVLVGHSMGAQIALACAAAWPERVAGLVLVGAGLRMSVAPSLFARLEADLAERRTGPLDGGRPVGGPRLAKWLERVAWSPSTPREIVERWAGVVVAADEEICLADFRAVDRLDGAPLATQVRAPTRILCGADDLLTPPALADGLGAAVSGARVEIVPRAGHMLMLEQPGAFFDSLAPFLSAVS